MASSEVQSLIKFLQINGGNVISGQTKFTVTAEILKEINQITQSIKEDIYVTPLTNTDLINKYSTNNELMFLYDFIKKTPKLKISNTVSSHNFTVNVSDFTNLKYLELHKLNVKYVKGIQFLRENLEMLACFRCLEKISDVLLTKETSMYFSSIWNKLTHAVLSRNNLSSLDESLIHTPWLQYLDISYNNLVDIRQLTCLRNLTHLNVSYNYLTEIPKFAMYKLKVLIMNNNYITDISGVSTLEFLHECDLSDNCISEHANLLPFADLPYLKSLNILRNPLTYHPMHRSLTCGYLHENIAIKYFLLDGQPLTKADREYFRYCSRRSSNAFASCSKAEISFSCDSDNGIESQEPSIVVKKKKKKMQKKVREAVIVDQSLTSRDVNNDDTLENLISTSKNEDTDDDEHLQLKKKIEALRKEHGPEYWLYSKGAKTVETLIGIESTKEKSQDETQFCDADKSLVTTDRDDTVNFCLAENEFANSTFVTKDTGENSGNSGIFLTDEQPSEIQNDSNGNSCDISVSCDSSVDKEISDTETGETIDVSEENLRLVERVEDDDKKTSLFLILNDDELREVDPSKQKVITRWSVDCIERYIKISNEPFELKILFDVMKRDNRQRRFIMEYADAKVLMSRIDAELESRNFNQILLRCMKCDLLFCQEIPRRKQVLHYEETYACTSCGSKAVLQEDVSVIENQKAVNSSDSNTPLKGTVSEPKTSNVTTSPSLSSIGSAASLDQNADSINNDESRNCYQESDIEVISNPSESSIEILAREPNRLNENKTVLQRLSEKMSISEISTGDLPSVSAALNQLLTESSSSGSMTDSSCTTVESNHYLSRGPHRISQSTVEEVLPEESSSLETSPQQRYSEERNETNIGVVKLERTPVSNYVSVLDVLHSVGFKMLSSTPPRKNDQNTEIPFEYSYTDFSFIDHRIKLYLWDQITLNNEEISAFVRVNAILKIGFTGPPFPGFVVFTSKKMYLVKITKKETDENPDSWLQKYENIITDKITLIKPILWKQGFYINTEESLPNGNTVKYIMLLYDEKRTESFVSYVKDLGIVQVQLHEDTSETRDLINLEEISEDVRNFTITDTVISSQKGGGDEIYNFVALVVTREELMVLKIDGSLSGLNIGQKPAILCKEVISNLMNVEITKNGISLLFENETEGMEKSWHVNTVSSDSTNSILDAIREPWEKLFEVQLPTSQTIN